MTKRKNPPKEPFRRSQVVSPSPSERRYAKAKFVKKLFDVYVTDIETADETYAMSVNAASHREAIQIAQAAEVLAASLCDHARRFYGCRGRGMMAHDKERMNQLI